MLKTYTRQIPVKSRGFPFAPNTVLAPMEGVTNFVIRNALSELGGIGMLCTEFVRISAHAVSSKTVREAVQKTPGIPLSVQVMGNDASLMADSAEKMEQAGADIVDINLGCPTKNAVKGNVGSAMLKDPDLLYDVLSSMRTKVNGWLSAKIRAGFDENNHVSHIAKTVEATGADFIAVHPRRRKDFYEGVADWRIIAHLKSILKIPVIGNGDIWYPQDALSMKEQTNCDAVMIGRGALRNPWIFKQIQQLQNGIDFRPGKDEMIEFFEKLKLSFLEAFKGREHGALCRMKELVKYFSRLFPDGVEFRTKILRTQNLDDFMKMLISRLSFANEADMDFFGEFKTMKSGSAI
ncbi:MAG: tRNA-dihydrouridine synthase family protein [Lentisphaeraceae bacterium]|nr:tRNA-dihydrouridine synthase family protein [Lentisphaeraceae bacterium]